MLLFSKMVGDEELTKIPLIKGGTYREVSLIAGSSGVYCKKDGSHVAHVVEAEKTRAGFILRGLLQGKGKKARDILDSDSRAHFIVDHGQLVRMI